MSKQMQVHAALFLVALIYGSNYSIAKGVMPAYVGPFGLIVIRVVPAAIFFGIFSRLVVKEKIVGKADNIRVILCGVFGVAVNQLCFFAGLNLTAPINAALLMVIVPVVVLMLSAIILKERVGWKKIVGIAIAFTGALLLIYTSRSDTTTTGNIAGDLLIILNAIAFGIYLVLVKPLMQRYHAITIVGRIFSVGAICVIPFGFSQLLAPDYSSFPTTIWVSIIFMIVAVTIIAYLLNTWALRYANPSLVGAYIYLQPVLAIIIAIGFGKDVFTMEKGFYALLIFTGVYLVSRTKQHVVKKV